LSVHAKTFNWNTSNVVTNNPYKHVSLCFNELINLAVLTGFDRFTFCLTFTRRL